MCKVMPLLFNMLSRLVIAFLPRSKCPLISWLQLPSAVILEPKKISYVKFKNKIKLKKKKKKKKIKSVTVFTISPSVCYEVMGPDAMILVI